MEVKYKKYRKIHRADFPRLLSVLYLRLKLDGPRSRKSEDSRQCPKIIVNLYNHLSKKV